MAAPIRVVRTYKRVSQQQNVRNNAKQRPEQARSIGSAIKYLTCAVAVLICLGGAVPVSHAQGSQSAAVRITQPISENNLVELKKSTHPLARPQFDRGAVADSVALEHSCWCSSGAPSGSRRSRS